jgi:hypothetical protein
MRRSAPSDRAPDPLVHTQRATRRTTASADHRAGRSRREQDRARVRDGESHPNQPSQRRSATLSPSRTRSVPGRPSTSARYAPAAVPRVAGCVHEGRHDHRVDNDGSGAASAHRSASDFSNAFHPSSVKPRSLVLHRWAAVAPAALPRPGTDGETPKLIGVRHDGHTDSVRVRGPAPAPLHQPCPLSDFPCTHGHADAPHCVVSPGSGECCCAALC